MNTPRDSSAATLLNNGTVLIVGGCCDSSRNPLTSAEIYDPVAGTFTYNRWQHEYRPAISQGDAAEQRNGSDYGRYFGAIRQPPTNIAELYDPAAGTFHPDRQPYDGRAVNHTATPLNKGTVLITGGQDASFKYLGQCGVVRSRRRDLHPHCQPMNTARAYHAATLLNGGTVLIAGCGAWRQRLNQCRIVRPRGWYLTPQAA